MTLPNDEAQTKTQPLSKEIPWQNSVILAPLTKGGNLPFREICVGYGASITVSEMAYAHKLCKNDRREWALTRRSPLEKFFGVQIAASKPQIAAEAVRRLCDNDIDFIDLNCGCPIDDTTRRGMGARLLAQPARLGRIVEAMVAASSVPITVKLRTGWDDAKPTWDKTAQAAVDAGAQVITLHGRSRKQRYARAANWDLIAELVQQLPVPVIGNGDILTHFEASDRRKATGCAGVMLGRGALIKPWLFAEIQSNTAQDKTAHQRIEMLWTLMQKMKAHFGSDDRGHRRVMGFFPWHLSLLCRYQPLPQEQWHKASQEHPLIQSRSNQLPDAEAGSLDRLLARCDEDCHQRIAQAVWEAESLGEAQERLVGLAEEEGRLVA